MSDSVHVMINTQLFKSNHLLATFFKHWRKFNRYLMIFYWTYSGKPFDSLICVLRHLVAFVVYSLTRQILCLQPITTQHMYFKTVHRQVLYKTYLCFMCSKFPSCFKKLYFTNSEESFAQYVHRTNITVLLFCFQGDVAPLWCSASCLRREISLAAVGHDWILSY